MSEALALRWLDGYVNSLSHDESYVNLRFLNASSEANGLDASQLLDRLNLSTTSHSSNSFNARSA